MRVARVCTQVPEVCDRQEGALPVGWQGLGGRWCGERGEESVREGEGRRARVAADGRRFRGHATSIKHRFGDARTRAKRRGCGER